MRVLAQLWGLCLLLKNGCLVLLLRINILLLLMMILLDSKRLRDRRNVLLRR